jgi:O-antigen/teichoic acid export membrane protein
MSKKQIISEQQAPYRQIMKATSLFGGVQVFQIIIQIIRSKFIAILLGPSGMGIAGLLTSTISLITGLTNFGLGISAVKNIAAAHSIGNETRIAIVVLVLQRLVWFTGVLGTFVTIILSSWLSQLAFGNKDYTFAFIWISITMLLNQLTSGQMVVLQGMRKLQYLAKANLYGSSLGLIITIPLYYMLGIDGIVPGIIIASFVALSLSWFYTNKITIKYVKVNRVRTIAESKSMLSMGFIISMSGLITLGTSYIVRIFISQYGGVEEVGLYNAGFAIINTYTGLIFTAMATDYYPRLSAVANDNNQCKKTINQQAEIALLILAPILIVFIVFIKSVVILLYSNKFISVSSMIYWAALGMFFKASSWAVSFIFLAKGSTKLFFWNELIANIYILCLNLLGYYYFGLTGLGISFLVAYFVYLVQVYFVAKNKFNFTYFREFRNIFGFQFILACGSFLSIKIFQHPYNYIAGVVLIIISFWFSYRHLNQRIGIKALLVNLIEKNK